MKQSGLSWATRYLDIETSVLRVLIIDNATLVFEDSQDVTLNVEYLILINGSHLQVRSELISSLIVRFRGAYRYWGIVKISICLNPIDQQRDMSRFKGITSVSAMFVLHVFLTHRANRSIDHG